VAWRLPVARGNGGGRPTANLLADHTVWGVAKEIGGFFLFFLFFFYIIYSLLRYKK